MPDGRPVVGNVAALTDHKDHATLIEAAALGAPTPARGALRVRGRGRAAAAGWRPCAASAGLLDRWIFAGVPARPRPADPRVHRLLPLVAHGGPRHQPARRHGLRAARWWPRPRAESPRRSRTGSPATWCPSATRRRWRAPSSRRSRETGARAGHGRRPGRRRFEERFTADRMVDDTLSAYDGPAVRVRAIVNPNAGVTARAAMDAMRGAETPWTGLDLQLTTGPGDARRMAREAAEAGFDVGPVRGWRRHGQRGGVGAAPLAHRAGPRPRRIRQRPRPHPPAYRCNPPRALRALQDAVVRRMDVGTVNGAPLPERGGRGLRRAGGSRLPRVGDAPAAGVGSSTTSAWRCPARSATAPAAGASRPGTERFAGPAFLVAFLNGRQYGGCGGDGPRARTWTTGCSRSWWVEDAPAFELLVQRAAPVPRRDREVPALSARGDGPRRAHRARGLRAPPRRRARAAVPPPGRGAGTRGPSRCSCRAPPPPTRAGLSSRRVGGRRMIDRSNNQARCRASNGNSLPQRGEGGVGGQRKNGGS